jgi:putative NADH-flavin reductase
MKVAIIGACGKLGTRLVGESLNRGYRVVAVCRESSAGRLDQFAARDGMSVIAAPVVSDEAALVRALAGCDAVVAVMITVGLLKATELAASLAAAAAATDVKRMVFTAGEVTARPEANEALTLRQRIMLAVLPPITRFTPYSMGDMLKASVLIRSQPHLEWTIVRAPTLEDTEPKGYQLCSLSEITSADTLSREDYAACLIDSLNNPDHRRRTLAVASASR